jgi:hypothetical protein
MEGMCRSKKTAVVSFVVLGGLVTIMDFSGPQRRHKVHKVEESRIELQNAEECDTTEVQ